MNWIEIFFHTLGGLALFLFGMNTLSTALKATASDRIRSILSHLTRNRVVALFIGMAVTMLIQSSSATTVMTISFVNAGLLSFKQAVALVLGANIGTTFTAWIVSLIGKFKVAAYALPAVGVGFIFFKFVKNRKLQDIGGIVFGFGLLFFGLDVMKEAFDPLRDSSVVTDMFAHFSHNPVLGVIVGAVFTMLLQSSSATIAIVQTLAFTGVISFDAAIPLILGDNIGTTITAQLASIGTSLNARRTAMAHLLFNILGTLVVLPLVWVGLYGRLVEFLLPGAIGKVNIMMHIAFAHSLFNVINAAIFCVLLNLLVKAATALTWGTEEEPGWKPLYLKESFLSDPMVAMQQVLNELVRMAELARETVHNAQEGFFKSNEKLMKGAADKESMLDEFQRAITSYLIRISESHLDTRESMEYPVLLHCVNDLEKIGDYAVNIVSRGYMKKNNKLEFAPEGSQEVAEMFDKLYELFDKVIDALRRRDGAVAAQALQIEDEIDLRKSHVRINHIRRLNENRGKPGAELMIMELANNIEKMGDHLISIAKAVGKDLKWGRKPGLDWQAASDTAASSEEADEDERETEVEPA